MPKYLITVDLVIVFNAILTSRQTCEKLQCLYENLMSNNFPNTAVLKKKKIPTVLLPFVFLQLTFVFDHFLLDFQ